MRKRGGRPEAEVRKRGGRVEAVVDILVVVDNSLYAEALDEFQQDPAQAIRALKNYYNLIVSLVGLCVLYVSGAPPRLTGGSWVFLWALPGHRFILLADHGIVVGSNGYPLYLSHL